MSDSIVLGGKVRKHSLAVFEKPPPLLEAPAQKRLLLPQGELAQLYDSEEGIRYLAYIELRPATVRGNHYHRIKKEVVYLLRGKLVLSLEDIQSKERAQMKLQAGDSVLITPGVAHALWISEPGDAIEYSLSRFDAADVYRYPLPELSSAP